MCSLAGRSVVISILMIVYGIELSLEEKETLVYALQVNNTFSKLSAFTMMLFILLCGSYRLQSPCSITTSVPKVSPRFSWHIRSSLRGS